MEQKIENTLEVGAIVDSGKVKYRIEKVLGQGGFGITYKVTASKMDGNIPIEVTYALKEFYMKDFSIRDHNSGAVISTAKNFALSRKAFLAEARRLASIKHKNIVAVNEVFEANNTAYYVMQYLEGESLYKYLDRKGALSVSEAMCLLSPVFDAVDYLHKNKFTHLDIKPDNIMLSKNRAGEMKPMLIDFGLSKHYDAKGNETSVLQQICVSPGYSPFEQYGGIHTFTPQADVYALAATLYHCLTGSVPPNCNDYHDAPKSMLQVIAKGLENVDTPVREAILSAMKVKAERTQSVASFISHLAQSTDVHEIVENPDEIIENPITEPINPGTVPINDPNPPRPPKPARPRWVTPLLIGLGVLVVGVLAFFAFNAISDNDDPIDTPAVQPVEVPAALDAEQTPAALPDKAVDLGLSVLWCDRNVGASSSSGNGNYYTFDEAGSAARSMGSGWRLPTKAELEELDSKCSWSWTGSGYRVTGPNGNSIYMPAAGWRYGSSTYYVGSLGYYWSSTPYGSDCAYTLYFDSGGRNVYWSYRSYGYSVRPVRAK